MRIGGVLLMGSMINLGLDKMEIDWGKNNVFRDHSSLFQEKDVRLIPYYYVDIDTEKPIVEMKEGLARKLSSVRARLDLIGYDLYSIERLYNDYIEESEEFGCKIHFTFDDFYSMLSHIDVSNVNTPQIAVEYDENGFDLGEYVRKCILEDSQIKSNLPIAYIEQESVRWRNSAYDLGIFFENIDPYITLRILAENPNNGDLEVQWRFADVVEGGWTKREDIVKPLSAGEKILIVTEGSSDSFIIKKAIDSLYPDITDFFDFVDMEENYPFTGVGNLYNFCLGLIRINVGNKILVIFDNDTAGMEKYELLRTIKKPNSLLITRLPDFDEFSDFRTFGPQGEACENINGKAISIECFLDFASVNQTPSIRWTSYNKKSDQYQGELISKDSYVRVYKGCNLTDGSYNSSKLNYLIDYLLKQWVCRRKD